MRRRSLGTTGIVQDGGPMVEPSIAEIVLSFILAYTEVSTVTPGVRNLGQLRSPLRAPPHRVPADMRQRLEAFWHQHFAGRSLLPW